MPTRALFIREGNRFLPSEPTRGGWSDDAQHGSPPSGSQALDPNEWLYVNPDITIYAHRLPDGEWLGMRSAAHQHDHGIGLADTRAFDRHGPLGRINQAQLLELRATSTEHLTTDWMLAARSASIQHPLRFRRPSCPQLGILANEHLRVLPGTCSREGFDGVCDSCTNVGGHHRVVRIQEHR